MGCAFSKVDTGPPPDSLLYCRLPEGVHSHMLEHVDLKKLTKLIKTGRLAPLYPHELAQQDDSEDCPICTVSYPSMNTASCCSARVCTECFVHHQTASDPPGRAQCPFCKSTPFAVRHLGSKPQEQLQRERLEEQRWKQARQRSQRQQDWPLATADNPTAAVPSTTSNTTHPQQQQQPAGSPSWQQQQQQHVWQHSWLDQLSSPSRAAGSGSSRTTEAINVFAGYHLRTSRSSGGPGPDDTGLLLDTAAAGAAAEEEDDSSSDFSETASVAAAVEAALAAAAAEAAGSQEELAEQGAAVGGLSLQRQLREEQQQQQLREQAYLANSVFELQMQQLDELKQLHEAGLLPGYATAELSGLHLEELDEILLEQAVMDSLQAGIAGTDCS